MTAKHHVNTYIMQARLLRISRKTVLLVNIALALIQLALSLIQLALALIQLVMLLVELLVEFDKLSACLAFANQAYTNTKS